MRISSRVSGLRRTMIREIFEGAPADAINLGLGQPDLVAPDLVALQGVRAIAHGWTGYGPTAGLPELRAKLAERYRGLAPDASGIVVTVGSQEALTLSCLGLLDPGQELLYPDPGYPAYPTVAQLLGLVPRPYRLGPENGFRTTAAAIERELTERTGAVVLCAPANPTGACPDADELQRLTALLAAREIPWISDEVYSGLTYRSDVRTPWQLTPQGGVVVSSLSKDLCMTGWRVGWVAGPALLIERLIAAHQHLVTVAPITSQYAALRVFSTDGERVRRERFETFRRRRERMAEGLAKVSGIAFEPPDGAFYYFIDAREHGSSIKLARRILDECRVITIPGEAFGKNADGFLRLSFAADEQLIDIALQRIAKLLARARS